MKEQDKSIEIKKCLTCDETFKSYKSNNRKYCNRTCFERRRKPTICKGCNTSFYIPGEPNMKYCSRNCYYTNGNIGTFKEGHILNLNKIHSQETKDKISSKHRINRSNIILGTLQFPNFNIEACRIIDVYGKENGYNFRHALNGGEYHIKELGYWVDGYDEEKNVVIEYQEKHHLTPKWIEKDKKRKERIIKTLKCKFIYIYFNNKIEIWE